MMQPCSNVKFTGCEIYSAKCNEYYPLSQLLAIKHRVFSRLEKNKWIEISVKKITTRDDFLSLQK
jgi:hypothetical protein